MAIDQRYVSTTVTSRVLYILDPGRLCSDISRASTSDHFDGSALLLISDLTAGCDHAAVQMEGRLGLTSGNERPTLGGRQPCFIWTAGKSISLLLCRIGPRTYRSGQCRFFKVSQRLIG